MKMQQFQPVRMPAQQPQSRRWWWVGLGILVALLVLAIARYASTPAERLAATSQPVAAPAAVVDPAAQSVLDYLRAHRAMQPPAQDAATRGVLGYLNAHRALETRPFDPAQQSVIDYLNAHRVAAAQRVPDAAAQGTLGYLNVHSAVVGDRLDLAQQSVMDYIRLHSR